MVKLNLYMYKIVQCAICVGTYLHVEVKESLPSIANSDVGDKDWSINVLKTPSLQHAIRSACAVLGT